ncbi:phosphonate C-P lyase system protein PhnH [Mahella sp.]|uniref:phosphonate C-P lyase system protein PhnH n=1 Tax=Mahella sp. TaxID=2798721 RepID=UPI0025BE8D75|nr:phosphonate C-P lyase system protein PhnH [Mahella sp.]MBZ4665414.1 phosphonate lyase system protein PhnH [Mahella sp.]
MAKTDSLVFDPVFDAQWVYRQLLDAMARPGKICSVLKPPMTSIALTLLDNEVTFAIAGRGSADEERHIRWLTGSSPAPWDRADYIFAEGALEDKQIAEIMHMAKRGSLLRPDESATIILSVEELGKGKQPGGYILRISGPGVEHERFCAVKGLSSCWMRLREIVDAEYPMGIDMIITDEKGEIIALPRTTIIKAGDK